MNMYVNGRGYLLKHLEYIWYRLALQLAKISVQIRAIAHGQIMCRTKDLIHVVPTAAKPYKYTYHSLASERWDISIWSAVYLYKIFLSAVNLYKTYLLWQIKPNYSTKVIVKSHIPKFGLK